MAVSEQTPYIEYTANGTTTSFALDFDCDNQDHLIVLVDDMEPVVGEWSLSNGNVVFSTAPENGKKITIQRNTPFSRTTDYQSYNNSFRPPAVNNDFDRVWYKIQELGVKDWLLNLKIQKFRDDVNLTALENTLEEARQIRDDTADSVIEVQSNVAQSQTLLENTTVQANLAQDYASSANSANAAAQQAVIDVSTAEADVYSALSAQQTAVNNSLTAIAGGHKAYQTLADAQAAQASLPANTVVEVTNDPTASNNGTYQWNGTTLTKSAYDPLTQAKSYADANKAFNPQPLANTINLDTTTTLGFYLCYATPVDYAAQNYPFNGNGFLRVYHSAVSGSSQLVQVFTNASGKSFTRYKSGATFTTWYNDYDSSVAYTQAMTQVVNTTNLVTGTDLNTLTTSGYYVQNVSADATLALNFPVGTAGAGFLEVVKFSPSLIYQTYQVRDTNKVYKRRYTGTWSAWAEAGLDNGSVTKAKLALSLLNTIPRYFEWTSVGAAWNVTYDPSTKTLTWPHMLLGASADYPNTLRIRIPSGSIQVTNPTGYDYIYLDLTNVDPLLGNVQLSDIKVGTYAASGYLQKNNQILIAKLDFAGNIYEGVGVPKITVLGQSTQAEVKDTFRFVKQAAQSYLYLPATNGNLIRYNFYRQIKAFDGTSPNSQSDLWRLADVYEANPDTLAAGRYIVVDGEWDTAIRVNGAADHSGGVHGDEIATTAYFLIDGCYYAQDAVFDGQVKELTFVQKSNIYFENTQTVLAERTKVMRVTKFGIKNYQKIVFKAIAQLFTAWLTMLPIKRTANNDGTGGQITDTAIRFPNYDVEDVATTGFTQVYTETSDGDYFVISSAASGISSEVKVSNFIGMPRPVTHISSAQFYNKLYFSAIDSRVANYTTSVDETWEVESEFKLNIK